MNKEVWARPTGLSRFWTVDGHVLGLEVES